MVDGVGTTVYSLNNVGQLLSEAGPWTDDTVSYTYNNRLLASLSLLAPNGSPWNQTYGYDAANRLNSLASPAGSFGYAYDPSRHLQVNKLSLPNGSYITNAFDTVARMLSTALKNSGNSVLNSHNYAYDLASERTGLTNTLGDYRGYTYDKIGQLKTAIGKESGGATNRWQESDGATAEPWYQCAPDLASDSSATRSAVLSSA